MYDIVHFYFSKEHPEFRIFNNAMCEFLYGLYLSSLVSLCVGDCGIINSQNSGLSSNLDISSQLDINFNCKKYFIICPNPEVSLMLVAVLNTVQQLASGGVHLNAQNIVPFLLEET
jgi:hypothetical protein